MISFQLFQKIISCMQKCDGDIAAAQVNILYGSQTGTSFKYSKQLDNAFAERSIECHVTNLASFDFDETFLNFKVPVMFLIALCS